VKLVVTELVSETKPQPAMAVSHHKCIYVDLCEVARQECIDFKVVKNSFERYKLNLKVEFNDLLNRDRKRSLVVKLGKELLCTLEKPPLRLADRINQLFELLSTKWLAS